VVLNEEDGIAEALEGPHDAAFIAASRTAVPELIAEVERLELENSEAVNAVLNQAGDNLCHLIGVPVQIPPRAEFLESCSRYHAQLSQERGELRGCKTIAQLEAELAQLREIVISETRARSKKPDFKTFVELKHGVVGDILWMLQDCQISRGKAAEALAEVAHGVEPRLPKPEGYPIPEDVTPSQIAAENSRLRNVIKSAEHGQGCHYLQSCPDGTLMDCDCWKRDALEGE
jgi:hypothetical protein